LLPWTAMKYAGLPAWEDVLHMADKVEEEEIPVRKMTMMIAEAIAEDRVAAAEALLPWTVMRCAGSPAWVAALHMADKAEEEEIPARTMTMIAEVIAEDREAAAEDLQLWTAMKCEG
jgi:hypothetical protein